MLTEECEGCMCVDICLLEVIKRHPMAAKQQEIKENKPKSKWVPGRVKNRI